MHAIAFTNDPTPVLSHVVLLRGSPAQARACLTALAAAEDRLVPGETILVTISGTDAARVAKEVRGARVLVTSSDLGTATSWNIAVGESHAPRFAIIHEDTQVRPGWSAALLGAMREDRRIGVIGPRLLNTDGSLQNCGWIMLRDGMTYLVDESTAPGVIARPGPIAVDLVSSACMVVDRELWDELGGFDERFFPAVGVEIDFALACWAAGRSVVCQRDVAVTHHTGAMVRPGRQALDAAMRSFLIRRNVGLLGAKWAPWLATFPRAGSTPGELRAAAAVRLEARRRDAARGRPDRSQPPRPRRSISAGARPVAGGPIPVAVADRAERARSEVTTALAEELAEERDAYADALRSTRQQVHLLNQHIAALDHRIAVLQERSDALDMVLGGRWWRLRGLLNRALPPRLRR